jgi:hypothetical protein
VMVTTSPAAALATTREAFCFSALIPTVLMFYIVVLRARCRWDRAVTMPCTSSVMRSAVCSLVATGRSCDGLRNVDREGEASDAWAADIWPRVWRGARLPLRSWCHGVSGERHPSHSPQLAPHSWSRIRTDSRRLHRYNPGSVCKVMVPARTDPPWILIEDGSRPR